MVKKLKPFLRKKQRKTHDQFYADIIRGLMLKNCYPHNPTVRGIKNMLQLTFNIRVRVADNPEKEPGIIFLYHHRKHLKRLKAFEHQWAPLGTGIKYLPRPHSFLKATH